MCGIAGIAFGAADRYRREDLTRMVQALAHRGPDGTGFLYDDAVWLGQQRLAVIDPKGGNQPVFDEDRAIAAICNGEIYNFKELRKGLEQAGHRFVSACDTEVIPHLYEEHGDDFVRHLDGMFAVAVLDRKRRRLVLARDRLGIKPLYFAATPGGLAFASELRALLTLPHIDRALDPDGVSQLLTYDAVPAPRTLLRGVEKLPAGTRLTWTEERTVLDRWWPASELYPPVASQSPESAMRRLGNVLDAAIRRHLVSDVPLGVFLSGGIDSSYIAAVMADSSVAPLRTYSIAFDEPGFDEGPFARRVAEHLGAEHRETVFTARDVRDLVPALPDLMDEPIGDPAILPTHLLARAARREVVVALSGEGGDELFYGYPTYRAHRAARWLERSPRFAGDLARAAAGLLPASSGNFAFDFVAKRFASGIGVGLAERHARWMGSLPPGKEAFFTPAFQAALTDPRGLEPILRVVAEAPHGADPLLVASHCDLVLYLEDGILMRTDKASMACALEVRVPFLDPEVVRFARALPASLKLRGRVGKYLLRRLAQDRLPDEIVRRPKKGFGLPLARWLRGELREVVHDMLSRERVVRRGIFRPEAIARLIDEHEAGRHNHRKALWVLLALELWLERFVPSATGASIRPARAS